MKKVTRILVSLIAVMLLVSVFSPIALAVGNDDTKGDQQEKKEEKTVEQQERKQEFEENKAEFELRKLERNEIRTATKTQLEEQKEIVSQHKQELKDYMASLNGMTDEERALYQDEINALKLQIKEAQKYSLQIMAQSKLQIREIFPGVKASGLPTEEQVQGVCTVIDDL